MKQNTHSHFIFNSFYLLLFVTILSFNAVEAQDSLRQMSYNELYELYKANKNLDPKKAEAIAEQLFQTSITENDRNKIAKALYNKAYVQKNLGNNTKALSYIDSSLEISRAISNDTITLQNVNLKGIISSSNGDYTKAIGYYLEAKSIAERMGNINSMLVISRNIGIIKVKISDYLSAIDDFLENLSRIRSTKMKGFEREHALNYFNIADTYLKLENYSQAKIYADSSLSFLSLKNVSDLYVPFYSNNAIIDFQQKNYKATIETCNDLVSKINKTENKKKLLTPYFYLGKSYFQLKKYDEAITYFEKVKTLIDTHKILFPELGEVYSLLTECYINSGNRDGAKTNINLLSEFNKKREETNTTVYYKIQKELETKLEVLNLKNEQEKRKVKTLYVFIALLAATFLILYLRKQTLNKKRYKKLLQTIEKLERPKEETQIVSKTGNNDVTQENVDQILKSLDKFEKSELFLNTQCNLVFVAKKLKTNTSYLSKVINTYKGKSFKSYITELRINASLVHLKNNKQLRLYTIKALAEEFGFKRYETFSRAFKKQTGIYPSVYIKNLQREKL